MTVMIVSIDSDADHQHFPEARERSQPPHHPHTQRAAATTASGRPPIAEWKERRDRPPMTLTMTSSSRAHLDGGGGGGVYASGVGSGRRRRGARAR